MPFPFGTEIALRGATSQAETMIISYDGARIRQLRTFTQDSSLFETMDLYVPEAKLRFVRRDRGTVRFEWDKDFPILRAWLVWKGRVEPIDLGSQQIDLSLRVDYTEPPPLPEDIEDRLLENAVIVMLEHARQASADRKAPMLLYLYDGACRART